MVFLSKLAIRILRGIIRYVTNHFFDEKIFLFLEEVDLCKRVVDSGGKIYIANNAKVYHSARKGSGED